METKKWKARKYHNFVWKTAKQDTEAYFYSDWRNWIGNIISGVGSAVIIPYILDIWKGGEMTLPFFYQVILALFSGVFGFAVFVVGLYLYNGIWLVPANLYRKKETEANLPSWSDIEIKEFYFDKTSGWGVGFEIIIYKQEYEYDGRLEEPYISDVMPKLRRITSSENTKDFQNDLSSLLPMLQGSKNFERMGHIQSEKHLKRDRRQHNVLHLAKWDNEKAWIIVGKKGNENKEFLDEEKNYTIEIEIRDANITPGIQMHPFTIKCDLLYVKQEDGNKKIVIGEIKRIPEFQPAT